MKLSRFVRTGNCIIDFGTNHKANPAGKISYPTINAAKRKSREIQLKIQGALGRGILVYKNKINVHTNTLSKLEI